MNISAPFISDNSPQMSAEMPSDSPHLLIAGAAPPLDAGATLPALPPLPNLDALLRRLRVVQRLAVDDADEGQGGHAQPEG